MSRKLQMFKCSVFPEYTYYIHATITSRIPIKYIQRKSPCNKLIILIEQKFNVILIFR